MLFPEMIVNWRGTIPRSRTTVIAEVLSTLACEVVAELCFFRQPSCTWDKLCVQVGGQSTLTWNMPLLSYFAFGNGTAGGLDGYQVFVMVRTGIEIR